MEEKSFLNKELYREYYEKFEKNITNDFIGDNFIENLEWAMILIKNKFKQIRIAEYLPEITRNHFDKSFLIADSISEMNNKIKFLNPASGYNATPEMFPALNIKWLNITKTITFKKIKEIEAKEKFKLSIKNKYAYEISNAFYKKDTESFYGIKNGYGVNNGLFEIGNDGKKLELNDLPVPISLHPGYSVPNNAIKYLDNDEIVDIIKSILIAYQIAMTMYYEWCIYIKEHDNIGLIIPIEPSILSEIYKTSILNFEDKKRMLHFVCEHYRRKIANPNEDYYIFVHKYLRGDYKFNYRNFYTEIIPPKYDLDRIKTRKKFIDSIK